MELLSILTPTYNRGELLTKAFDSLQNQSNKNFLWVIVDDGSSDNTMQIVNSFRDIANFKICYIAQENGGKHRALNTGIKYITTELTLILDSDDVLRSDAVEIIEKYWNQVREYNSVAYISFLRCYSNGEIIGDKYPKDEMISDHITCCMNGNILGDKSEVYRTAILKQYPFPEIFGEKFLSEGVVWNRIGKKFKALYVNKPIYITEYLDGGLTKAGIKLRLDNPIGAMLFAKECITREYNLKLRLKYSALYNLYYIIAKTKKRIIPYDYNLTILGILTFPFSFIYFVRLKMLGLC